MIAEWGIVLCLVMSAIACVGLIFAMIWFMEYRQRERLREIDCACHRKMMEILWNEKGEKKEDDNS